MSERLPNLVQRAADRLRQPAARAAGPFSPSGEELTAPASAPSRAASFTEASLPPRERTPAAGSRPATSVTISPASLVSHGIALPSAGLSRTVQEFRALKRELTGIVRRESAAGNRIVLVTSAQPGEGKTFTAANLALALAYEKEPRVLLMDADAYRHSLMEYLGVSASQGWLDVVSDAAELSDVLLGTNLPNLDLLPAGRERQGIPELMSSRRMNSLFEELGRQDSSRIVIVDSVPCLTSTEPSILAGLAAQTLLVVAAHETARDQIEASLRVLKASPSISLVLNKAHPALTDRFKGYGYNYASADKAA